MSDSPANLVPTGPAKQAPLGHHVARGFAWNLAVTVLTKVLTMVSQIVLAWLLGQEDFGLIGLAYTVTSLCGVIRWGGLTHVLTQRQAYFNRWANPAFWMSFFLTVLATITMLIAAPIAAWTYGRPQLIGLICVLAAAGFMQTFSFIPGAKLAIALRFRTLSALSIGEVTVVTVLSIVLASPWIGAGAYSFVIPTLVVGILRIPATCMLSRTGLPRWRLEFRRWRYLLRDSGLLLITALLFQVTLQGDYVILGFFAPTAVVGVYYLAFSLSMQVISFLTNNLGQVLFPTLSRLQDDSGRQVAAFMRACRVLGMVAIPLCFTQAALIDAGVRCFLSSKWLDAIPIAQILSVGMALRTVTWAAPSLLQAQGRFGIQTLLFACSTALFLASVLFGAALGGAVGTALAEAAFFTLVEPVLFFITVRTAGGNLREAFAALARPIVCGVVVGLVAWLASQATRSAFLPTHLSERLVSLVQLLLGGSAAVAIFLLLAPRITPNEWNDLLARVPALQKFHRVMPAVKA